MERSDPEEEMDMPVDVADNIEDCTICALGDAAAWPVHPESMWPPNHSEAAA